VSVLLPDDEGSRSQGSETQSSLRRIPTVLVTGCSSGIGKAVCDYLATAGWRVYGGSRSLCVTSKWTHLPLDVTHDASIAQAVSTVLAREGRIDALVTAAGRSLMGALEDTTIDEAKQLFDINFFGTVSAVKAVLPIMRRQRAGKIALIGSIGGVIGLPYLSYYSATKFALNGLVEALRPEVSEYGVQVCVINPGDFRTNISINELHAVNSAPHSPYFGGHQRARDLYGTRIKQADPPLAVAKAVHQLLTRRTLPVRRVVGSSVERLGLVAKNLLSSRVFEHILKKNRGY